MNTQPTIDPCLDGIRAHACIKHIPQWPDNGPRYDALRREIQATGIVQPVLMTAKHEIVCADSRERWRAARALQLVTMPIVIVADEQIVITSLNALVHRRHLTKSALAYLSYPLLKPAYDEIQHQRIKNLKKANDLPKPTLSVSGMTVLSVGKIAEGLGISEDLLQFAKKVHEIFAKDAAFKAQMEPRILCEPIGGEHEQHRPVGLGAVIAGYEGKKNEDKPRPVREQLELFGQAVKSFCIRAPLAIHETQALRVIEEQFEKFSPEEIENAERTAAMIVKVAKKMAKKNTK